MPTRAFGNAREDIITMEAIEIVREDTPVGWKGAEELKPCHQTKTI